MLCQVWTQALSGLSHIHLLLMGFRKCYPQMMIPWHVDYLKLKESEEWQKQEGHSELLSSSPFYSPEIGYKKLM